MEEEEEPEEASAETTEKAQDAPQTFSKMDDALKALGKKEEAAPTSEVEIPKASEADAPVANGNPTSVEDAKPEAKANGAAAEAPKVQELNDEETW